MLEAVQNRIAADPLLATRVHLLGEVPHEHVQQLMRAADVFVSGSHVEGSGYALIEALACGLLPVVTDIPSFRSLTREGRVGRLWACGDAEDLARALLEMGSRAHAPRRAEIRSFFDAELSFDCVGRALVAAYTQVLNLHDRASRASEAPVSDAAASH